MMKRYRELPVFFCLLIREYTFHTKCKIGSLKIHLCFKNKQTNKHPTGNASTCSSHNSFSKIVGKGVVLSGERGYSLFERLLCCCSIRSG